MPESLFGAHIILHSTSACFANFQSDCRAEPNIYRFFQLKITGNHEFLVFNRITSAVTVEIPHSAIFDRTR